MAAPVDPTCVTIYKELKERRKHKHIIYGIENDKITVLKTSTNPDYAELLKELPAISKNECRWAVYDANVEQKSGIKNQKICFIAWAPDSAKLLDKMRYTTSKLSFRAALDSTELVELQATDAEEVAQPALEYKLQGKLI